MYVYPCPLCTVDIYIYIYVYICMYKSTYICTYIYIYIYIDIDIDICIQIYIPATLATWTYTCVYMNMYMHVLAKILKSQQNWEQHRERVLNPFKVSSIVISCGKLSSVLTFEKFYLTPTHLPVEILKRQLATQFTIEKHYWTEITEYLPIAQYPSPGRNSQKSAPYLIYHMQSL